MELKLLHRNNSDLDLEERSINGKDGDYELFLNMSLSPKVGVAPEHFLLGT